MKVKIIYGEEDEGGWGDSSWDEAHFKKNPPLKDFIDYLTSRPGTHKVFLDNFRKTNLKAVITNGCITQCDFTEDEMKKTAVLLGGIVGNLYTKDFVYGIIIEG